MSNEMQHSTTVNHEFIDPQSGVGMELRVTSDDVVGIILNSYEDDALYLTVEQLRPVAQAMQDIISAADTRKLIDSINDVVTGLDQPQERKPPYSDPSEASEYDMAEWNIDALEYAQDYRRDVTFTYRGEHDPYPRQRHVFVISVEGTYGDAVIIRAYDHEDDDQIKQFRFDRIKSHILVLDG